MRPGGTQTKHGAAVRMRRRLGLAPRAYVLLSCSLVLVIAGVSAYGMTVPSMVQAHAARELHIGRKTKSDLGTTTGFAWASVVGRTVFGVDPADEGERASNEITLANGKTMLAVEIRRLLQQNYDVSYALSGEGGVWRALDLTEEGPDTTKANYISGAASPYLARFDSGEVVMTYATGNRLLARLGAPDGSGFSNTSFSILPDAPGFWGSVERVGSHAMLFTNQATSSDGKTSGIAMIRGYLNHRINAPKYTVT